MDNNGQGGKDMCDCMCNREMLPRDTKINCEMNKFWMAKIHDGHCG